MNSALMFCDHADRREKLDPKPAKRKAFDYLPSLLLIAIVTAAMGIALVALRSTERAYITAVIYQLTNEAIAKKAPACEVITANGIKVQSCITTVAQ